MTYIPAGYSVAVNGTAALVADAGVWNSTRPSSNLAGGLLYPLGRAPQLSPFLANLRRQMTKQIEFFTEFFYRDDDSSSLYNPAHNMCLSVHCARKSIPANVGISVPTTFTVPYVGRNINRRLLQDSRQTCLMNGELNWTHMGEHRNFCFDLQSRSGK